MTEFDRKVLTWLNTADVTDKAKTTMISRVRAGIDVYRHMLHDDPKLLERVPIDLGLDEECCRAERRVAEGISPIVQLPPAVPQLTLKRSGTASTSVTPRLSTAQRGASSASETAAAPRPTVTPRPATASARAAMVSKPGRMKINATPRLQTQSVRSSAAVTPAANSPSGTAAA